MANEIKCWNILITWSTSTIDFIGPCNINTAGHMIQWWCCDHVNKSCNHLLIFCRMLYSSMVSCTSSICISLAVPLLYMFIGLLLSSWNKLWNPLTCLFSSISWVFCLTAFFWEPFYSFALTFLWSEHCDKFVCNFDIKWSPFVVFILMLNEPFLCNHLLYSSGHFGSYHWGLVLTGVYCLVTLYVYYGPFGSNQATTQICTLING